MSAKLKLKAFYRRHANCYPNLYNAHQQYSVLLRSRLNFVHEEDFRALPLLGMPGEACCIDIGGNCGQSITAIKSVARNARIVSFEPNPAAYKVLAKVARNLAGVTTHNVAVGACDGETAIFIPRCRGVIFDQLAATHLPDISKLAQLIRSFGYSFVTKQELTFDRVAVEVRKLDCFGFVPDFIKIDVEGTELEVLRGADRTLRENRPALLIEGGERTEIERFLSARGYRRYIYAQGMLTQAANRQALNHFYLPEQRKAYLLPRDVQAETGPVL